MKKIAVLDWGIGGFSFVRALRAAGHRTTVLYFSDSGMTPYGLMAPNVLRSRLRKVIAWCKTQGCEGVVVACNAASSVLEETFAVCGVIRPTIQGMKTMASRSLHVIGGERTIRSGIYQKAFPDATFRIAQPLSALIERGDEQGIHDILPRLLEPSQTELLCACTHYEAIIPCYFQYMPRLKTVLRPSIFTLERVQKRWLLEQGEELDSFYTSGSLDVGRVVTQVFGISWPNPIQKIIQ